MSNISITLSCNRQCGYCFARSPGEHTGHMRPEIFAQALDFLERSGIRQVPVLGGEPTIHPLFGRFIDMIKERGLDLLLFSNGRMPVKALSRLESFPAERLSVLLNIDPAACLPEPEDKRLRQVLAALGGTIVPGCTIHHPGVSPAPFLPLIKAFGLAPVIRAGLAHPRAGAENHFLHPRHYRTVGRGLGLFVRQALDQGVRLEFDCGFVPCMFDEEDLALFATLGDLPGSRCNPLPDFLPNGLLIPCYPLARVCQTPCLPGDTSRSVRARLSEQLAVFAQTGIYGECGRCPLREQSCCNGGCRAAALQRMRPFPMTERIFAGARQRSGPGRSGPQPCAVSVASGVCTKPGPDKERWSIPYIDQPPAFWREIHARYGSTIQEVYLPLPRSLLASGRPALRDGHLETFLRHGPLPVSVLLNPVVLPRPAAGMAAPIVAALKDLRAMTRLNGVTITDINLARIVKERLPDLPLTASVLMDVAQPHQAHQLAGICETLVPASRIMRNYPALQAVGRAFPGSLRLIVNEGCLPDCLMRVQHFYEMGYAEELPLSLCNPLLDRYPWMRLTGAWALPQHLHFFDGLTRAFKLAGRATLQDPARYLDVLDAYITRRAVTPDCVGGGPASPLTPIHISDAFYHRTLHCDKCCHSCPVCREYYELAVTDPGPNERKAAAC
ncbi:MAG: radical SAM protein [Desulfovibrio sp.]|nr:radical SAM protein [Desulfovibrio sp.]